MNRCSLETHKGVDLVPAEVEQVFAGPGSADKAGPVRGVPNNDVRADRVLPPEAGAGVVSEVRAQPDAGGIAVRERGVQAAQPAVLQDRGVDLQELAVDGGAVLGGRAPGGEPHRAEPDFGRDRPVQARVQPGVRKAEPGAALPADRGLEESVHACYFLCLGSRPSRRRAR